MRATMAALLAFGAAGVAGAAVSAAAPTAAAPGGASLPVVPQPLSTLPPASAAMVALAPTPPMGWNPWYKFGCGVSEQLVEQTAQAMVTSGMAADGYRYVNLDDCWMAPQRDASGSLQADPQKFPDGIAALATFVHGLGLKLGIYLDAGTQTCMGLPGSGSHFGQDAATIASWGVDYLKLDYCFTSFAPPEQLYSAMQQALAATGRPIVLSVSDDGFGLPWQWGAGIGNLWRTTNDYQAYGATTGNWWGALQEMVNINAGLFRYAQPGAWNDPDMLLTGTGLLSVPQERAQFSLWSMMAAPLLVSTDIRTLSPATASILTNRDVIAVDQDPAGRQGTRIVDRGAHQVWLRTLADGSHAVLFFNAGSRPATMQLSASRAGVTATRYRVRDLWRHRTWVSSAAKLDTTVAPNDVVMLRVWPSA